MKSFIVLSCVLAVAVASYVPADTPEVAAAKAQHFAAHQQATARNWASDVVVNNQWVAAAPAWNNVWTARAANWYAPSWQRWYEPAQIAVVNGHVQDTPEVAAEKAKHFALYAESAARNAAAGSTEWADNAENWKAWGSPAAVSTYAAVAPVVSGVYPSWAVNHGVAPIVVANGHVQDTAEVAVEKAKHLALVAEAKARNGDWSEVVAPVAVAPVAVAPVAHAVAPVAAVADLHSQYHAQDEAGQYTYGYNGGLSTKNEEKTVDGVTRGAYSYVDANGIVQSRSYVADSFGFRVAATDLPQDAPAVAAVAAPIVAAPVHSVYAAPAVYQRAAAVPAQVVVKADGTLEDTPEVAAAKAQHFAAHQQEHARLVGGAW